MNSKYYMLEDKKNISNLKRKLIEPTLQEKNSMSKVSSPNYILMIYDIFYSQ